MCLFFAFIRLCLLRFLSSSSFMPLLSVDRRWFLYLECYRRPGCDCALNGSAWNPPPFILHILGILVRNNGNGRMRRLHFYASESIYPMNDNDDIPFMCISFADTHVPKSMPHRSEMRIKMNNKPNRPNKMEKKSSQPRLKIPSLGAANAYCGMKAKLSLRPCAPRFEIAHEQMMRRGERIVTRKLRELIKFAIFGISYRLLVRSFVPYEVKAFSSYYYDALGFFIYAHSLYFVVACACASACMPPSGVTESRD